MSFNVENNEIRKEHKKRDYQTSIEIDQLHQKDILTKNKKSYSERKRLFRIYVSINFENNYKNINYENNYKTIIFENNYKTINFENNYKAKTLKITTELLTLKITAELLTLKTTTKLKTLRIKEGESQITKNS